MRVMVMVKATRSSEAGEMPGEQLLIDMGEFNEELVNAGIMQAGEGLQPSSRGVRVRFSGKNRTVTDGAVRGDEGSSSPASGSGRFARWRRAIRSGREAALRTR